MITGMASAPSPAKKAGVKKFKRSLQPSPRGSEATEGSSNPPQALARREIGEERAVERAARVEQRVVDPLVAEQTPKRRDVLAHHLAILLAQILRDHRHFLAGLQVDEVGRVDERKLELGRIEKVKDHD